MGETKQIYVAREGSPFKQEDAQEIGEFIAKCKVKTTRGILQEIKRNPKSKIYSLFEWDKDKAVELYQLQRVREIVSHISVNIITIGNNEPVDLSISVSAFKSVSSPSTEENIYVPISEGLNNSDYRKQIIDRAKTELNNWMERYQQYQELSNIINAIKKVFK